MRIQAKFYTKELNLTGYILLLSSSMLYGGNLVAGRFISGDIPPIALSMLRGLFGLLVLFPLAWHSLRQSPKPTRMDLYSFALLGFLGITVAYGTFLWAIQYSTATNAAIIFALNPALTNILLTVGWGIIPSRLRVLGIGLSFSGLVVVISQGSFTRLITLNLNPCDLVLLLNVVAVALFSILGQGVMKKFTPLVTSVYSLFFGTIFLSPYGIWELLNKPWYLSRTSWLVVLYMGCLVTGIAILLYLEGISRIGSGKAAIFNNIVPVFGILLAFLFLDERLALYHLIGFSLVLIGIGFCLYPRREKASLDQASLLILSAKAPKSR